MHKLTELAQLRDSDAPADSDIDLCFTAMRKVFVEFRDAVADDDHDKAFVKYQKFQVLSLMILRSIGTPSHFEEESSRVSNFLEYKLGYRASAGYCRDFESAEYILGRALNWDDIGLPR